MQCVMCTLDYYQCWAVKPRLPWSVNCPGVYWKEGKGGLKGIVVSGRGYNEVLALRMLNVVDYVEQGRCAKLPESASTPHPIVVALSFQLCACMCTSTCACVWTCIHTYARSCMCACTCLCACARVRVHAHAYACACMCR